MLRFTLLAILLAAVLIAAVKAGITWGWFQRPGFDTEIIVFMTVSHIGLYSTITRQLNQRPELFVKIYLGATVLRILFFGVFVFAIIWLDPTTATQNALLFLLSYFLFTSLEVSALFIAVINQKPTNLGQKEG